MLSRRKDPTKSYFPESDHIDLSDSFNFLISTQRIAIGVGIERLELSLSCENWLLKPARLPIPPYPRLRHPTIRRRPGKRRNDQGYTSDFLNSSTISTGVGSTP